MILFVRRFLSYGYRFMSR